MLWQFGQRSNTFSSLWSSWTPLTCSTSKGIFCPNHSEIPHRSQLYPLVRIRHFLTEARRLNTAVTVLVRSAIARLCAAFASIGMSFTQSNTVRHRTPTVADIDRHPTPDLRSSRACSYRTRLPLYGPRVSMSKMEAWSGEWDSNPQDPDSQPRMSTSCIIAGNFGAAERTRTSTVLPIRPSNGRVCHFATAARLVPGAGFEPALSWF